jgi:hypothetical protein
MIRTTPVRLQPVSRQDQLRPRYISIADATRYTAVSRSHFYNIFMPRVRTIRLGKSRLIELESLDAVLDELAGVE